MEKSHNTVTAYIHPIVALTISDQWTRRKMNSQDAHPKVIGYISGKRDGLRVEVNRASLLIFDEKKMEDSSGSLSFDDDFFKTQVELSKEMYPDEDLLGWYTNGNHVTVNEAEASLNRQFSKYTDRPLLLKFDTEHLQITGKLNIGVFETGIDLPSNSSFYPMPLHFETEASELIGLEHMASFSATADYSHTSASKLLTSLSVSMDVFHHRLRVCHEYMKAVISGELQPDEKIISGIFKLCLRLKALKSHSTSTDNQSLVSSTKQILNIAGLTALYEEVNAVSEFLNTGHQELSSHPQFFRRFQPGNFL